MSGERPLASILRHRVLRNSLVYVGSGVVRNALPFLLLPVLTRYLTPDEVGIVATFEIMIGMGLVLVGLNAYGAIAVNFFRLQRSELQVYVSNVIVISVLASLLVLGIAYGVLVFVPLVGAPSTQWLFLIATAAFAQVLFSITLTLWQTEQRSIPYGLFQISQSALNVGLSLLFVVIFRWGWEGRILAITAAAIAFGILSWAILHKRGYVRLNVHTGYIRDALAFGVPLVPHSLGNWILTGVDRLFLASMVGVAAAGVYTVGYQIGMIVGLLATSFNQAWSPFLFAKLTQGDPEARIRIVKFTYAYILGIVVVACSLSVIAPWFLSNFVGSEFQEADKYVFWIALGYAVNGMYLMVANYIYHARKTHLLAWVTLSTAAVNILLNYVLIRANGPIGAAQASAASFFLGFMLTWILSAKVCPMPWRVWNVKAVEEFRAAFRVACV